MARGVSLGILSDASLTPAQQNGGFNPSRPSSPMTTAGGAIAFVTEHPGRVRAVVLDPAVLDRIDGLVAPGVVLKPADTSYGEQVLRPFAPAAVEVPPTIGPVPLRPLAAAI
jgi:hypothetical protein